MGERVTVTVKILHAHLQEVEALLSRADDGPYEIEWADGTKLVELVYHDVNYGTLHALEKLHEAGIAYSYHYDGASEWGPGEEHLRFTADGRKQYLSFCEDTRNPPLSTLIELTKTPAELVQYILKYRESVTPLPWQNQEYYGKLYRAQRLLLPEEELLV